MKPKKNDDTIGARVASSTECTGVLPAMHGDAEADEAQICLCADHRPEKPRRAGNRR